MEPVPAWKSSLPAYFTEHYSDHTQGWKAQCFQVEVLEDEVRGCKNIWKITLEKFQDRGNLRRIWGMERKDHNLHLNAIQITTQFSKCWCMGEIPRSWAENSTWKECKSRRVWRLVLSKLNRLMDTSSFLSKESLPWKKRQCHSTKRLAFPGGAAGKEHACQSRRQKRCGFDFWVEKIPWRRKWQPTPEFLPKKSHGQRSLAGYSPWGRKESDTMTQLNTHACTKVAFSHSVVFNSLWPHGLQHARLPCPSPTPGAYSNSCPSSQWCHPTISSSLVPFSSHLQ